MFVRQKGIGERRSRQQLENFQRQQMKFLCSTISTLLKLFLLFQFHSCNSTAVPIRIKINGSKLIHPLTNLPFRLTGFNMGNHLHSIDAKTMLSILPGANVVRLVVLDWDNTGNPNPSTDCMTAETPFIHTSCLLRLDRQIKQITSANIWVILTDRSKYGAGADFINDPTSDVFHNATLRSNMYVMWKTIAARYLSYDYIAAYEIMSEPRDKSATFSQIHDFYSGGCAAVHSVDPRTPCMIGPGPYYKLWHFNTSMILKNDTNIIYTFDYFQPSNYIFATANNDDGSKISKYPSTQTCSHLYLNFAKECCPNGNTMLNISFDSNWHRDNFQRFAVALRTKSNVPIFMNQWSVVRKVTKEEGRYHFVEDIANITQQLDIGWTWWVWRGDSPKNGSSAFIYYASNGSVIVEHELVAAVKPYMSDTDTDKGKAVVPSLVDDATLTTLVKATSSKQGCT